MKIIFIYLISLPMIIFGDESGGLSFLNIPTSGNSASLGNTITADLYRPTSLLQNPANIWQNSQHTFSISKRSAITQTNYLNGFYGLKIRDLTFCLGVVKYGVNKIEEYDTEANFLGYFNFQNWAIALGTSKRMSGMLFGIGVSHITQNFTQISYNKENFLGLDIGVTVMDLLYRNNNVILTVSYVNKIMFDIPDFQQVNSATSNNILGIKTLFRQNSISLSIFSDLLFNANSKMVNMRAGLQPQINFKNNVLTNAGINIGLNKLPLYWTDDDIFNDDFIEYSRKLSIGGYLEIMLPVINQNMLINYAYENHKVLPASQYVSIQFSI